MNKKQHSVTAILATYDEAQNISPLIDKITEVLGHRDLEIVVVDDNSPDGTWKIVQEKCIHMPHLRLIHRTDERGLTSALNRGIQEASKEVVCWLDCDFQHPPEKLEELLIKIDEGYDAAVGSRFIAEGDDRRLQREHESSMVIRTHGWLSQFICRATTFMLKSQFTDWTSGLIAVKRSILMDQPLYGNYGEYFMYLLRYLDKIGVHAIEIPYVLGVRERGYSKTSGDLIDFARKGIRYLRVMADLKLR